MIVVAIVAVLAAIAIPNFYEMQLKAKRAEAYPNTRGILDASIAYAVGGDENLPNLFPHPSGGGVPGKSAVSWDPAPPDFAAIEWRPDGDVRCQYQGGGGPVFVVEAGCNVDGDVVIYRWTEGYHRLTNEFTAGSFVCDPAGADCY